MDTFFINIKKLFHEGMTESLLAMVGGAQNEGVVGEVMGIEGIQDFAYLSIDDSVKIGIEIDIVLRLVAKGYIGYGHFCLSARFVVAVRILIPIGR